MSRTQISIRLERTQRERLINLAEAQGRRYSDLIREQIDYLLLNGTTTEQKERVIRILRELRGPFMFFKTQQGIRYANKERDRREAIASKIEQVFNIQ